MHPSRGFLFPLALLSVYTDVGLSNSLIFTKTLEARNLLLVFSKLAFASDRISLIPLPQMGIEHCCSVGQLGSKESGYS